MPYDDVTNASEHARSLNDRIVDLMDQSNAEPAPSQVEFDLALRAIVLGGRDDADRLWEKFRGGRPQA